MSALQRLIECEEREVRVAVVHSRSLRKRMREWRRGASSTSMHGTQAGRRFWQTQPLALDVSLHRMRILDFAVGNEPPVDDWPSDHHR